MPGNGAPLPSIDGGGGDGGAAKAARTMPHKSATLVCFSTDTAMKGCASASAWIWGSGHGRRSVLLHTFGKSGAGAAGEASGRGMAREGERASAAAVTASARLGGAYHDRRPLSVCAQVVCDVLGERPLERRLPHDEAELHGDTVRRGTIDVALDREVDAFGGGEGAKRLHEGTAADAPLPQHQHARRTAIGRVCDHGHTGVFGVARRRGAGRVGGVVLIGLAANIVTVAVNGDLRDRTQVS